MSTPSESGSWLDGTLPPGVRIGSGTLITGAFAFKRFYNKSPGALVVGDCCTLDGVQFAAGVAGTIEIGHHCYMNNTVILAEMSVEIGSYVMIGWNTTIADADFHPIDPALRIEDAIACSPLAEGRKRPRVDKTAVRIEDDVYIGPSVAILKGVSIGCGAFIEPGSVVTRHVPERARVLGNPARVIGKV